MASQANWELDPETRTKLAALQKKEGAGNDRCCDCGAPSPQWASPKFAIFICLQCAGKHRGLGVHISFVRSISMDAFKNTEIIRMQLGGNKTWQNFFEANYTGAKFQDLEIKDRYDCDAGEEYKERLTAKAEGRDFDEVAFKKERAAYKERQAAKEKEQSRSGTPAGANRSAVGSNINSRTASPAPGKGPFADPSQKAKNEAYFARMGEANANRSADLPPSQGGKYSGFGSAPAESGPSNNGGNEFPDVASTINSGWSWLTKTAATVNKSIIQPAAKNIATTDFATQARNGFTTVSSTVATGAKGATEQFHKFVEGNDEATRNAAQNRAKPENEDFWNNFGQSSVEANTKPAPKSSVGTAAMKKPASQPDKKKDDGWGDDW